MRQARRALNRCTGIGLGLLTLLAGAATKRASAEESANGVRFTLIGQTGYGITELGPCSLNDAGRVVFVGRHAVGATLYAGSGGALTAVVDYQADGVWPEGPAYIDSAGRVGFGGTDWNATSGFIQGHLYRSDAPHTVTRLVRFFKHCDLGSATPDPVVGGELSTYDNFRMSDSGNIVFTGYSAFHAANEHGPKCVLPISGVGGIFVTAQGGGLTAAASYAIGTLPAVNFPGISSDDRIVYLTLQGSPSRRAIFIGGTELASSDGTLSDDIEEPVINASGTAVFAARLDTAGSKHGVMKMNAGDADPTAVSGAAYDFAYDPSINDAGRIVFTASFGGTGLGIFTGSDPVADRIIAKGDPLFGSTVTVLDISAQKNLNAAGQIAFRATLADGRTVIALASTIRKPVLILPGIAGTYAADANDDGPWTFERGIAPSGIQIDPLANVYDDLVKTLENVGYVRDKDLFLVNYDWRLPPGPSDGTFDGVISGLTGASITDSNYEYAVDYVGEALKRALTRWETDHPTVTLESVDVISHSTGGLVARAYIQSGAYGDVFDGSRKLPRVDNCIMIGVPNRGASKAWNPLHDNWVADPTFQAVLSKILNRAYQKVQLGAVIAGPPQPIDLAAIQDGAGHADPVTFIAKYVPTVRGIL